MIWRLAQLCTSVSHVGLLERQKKEAMAKALDIQAFRMILIGAYPVGLDLGAHPEEIAVICGCFIAQENHAPDFGPCCRQLVARWST
jgi:hypothetical protein